MRRNYLPLATAVLVMAMLSACGALGVPKAESFGDRAIYANAGIGAAAATINEYSNAGKISKKDAQNALDQVKNLAQAVDIAEEVHEVDPKAGSARLDAVIIGLRELHKYLDTVKPNPGSSSP